MITKEELKEGEVLLHTIKSTKSEKVQLVLTELLPTEKNPLYLMNKDDPRFNKTQRFGHAYLTSSIEAVREYFPELDEQLTVLDEGRTNELKVSIKNPEIEGERLRVQITETTGCDLATEYAETISASRKKVIGKLTTDFETSAKRAGELGPYLLKDGYPIFRENTVVFGEPKHTLLKHNGVVEKLEIVSNGVDMIGEPIDSTKTMEKV